MEQNRNRITPEASTDEPASSFNLAERQCPPTPPDAPDFEPPPLLSDCLDESLDDALAETFPAGGRKPRHDGWTPEAVAGFLRHLAATGIVEHAARAVGRSAQSAYAFRNRREGRAFARMWDAMLIHRARARIASELQARSIAGCVSIRKRDGVVVGEYHYHDNRLAMALLTRLDRLAEREAPAEAQLRALSEDLDDYCDCLAGGGDADAFVEARKPVEPEPEAKPAPLPREDDPGLGDYARLTGCHHYRDVHPCDIEVRDLDPTRQTEWDPDQWMRFFRSGFSGWLEIRRGRSPDSTPGPGSPLRFHFARLASDAAEPDGDGEALPLKAEEAAAIDTSDLDPAAIWDWTDDQLARAWRSGLLQRLPMEFWDDLAASEADDGEEE
jgi:hypothetical protein